MDGQKKMILTSKKEDAGLTAAQSLICGGIAGATSRTVTSPLDVVKILFQVQSAPIGKLSTDAHATAASAASAAHGGRTVYTGFLPAFATIYKEEGLRGFWKGNGVACLRLFPYSAVKFFVFDELKPLFLNKMGRLDPNMSVVCGATAGIIATLAVYPLDLVKTRLTVQNESHADKAYNGVIDCMAKVYKTEGVRGWYKGAYTSVIGVIPFEGGTFMFYEILKNLGEGDKKRLSPFQNFLNGCLGAAFAQTFSYPFDLVRKRLQAQSKAKGMLGEQYAGMVDCFGKIVKSEGFFGLYKGTIANLAKVAPYAGIMFATWEQCKIGFVWYNKTYHKGPYAPKKFGSASA
jgi:hypothetical protein